MHANTDEDGFVKKMTYTPGNVHDSKEFDRLLDINTYKDKIKTYGEVYADSAYANKQNDKKIGKQNNKILHRAYRNKARAQPIAISHNLKTGMNIFKEMQRLKNLRGCYVQ